MSNYYFYHDDPIDEPIQKPRKRSRLASVLLLILGAGFLVQTTLAANISLTSNGSTEFGQGVQQTIYCGGSSSVVTIKPSSTFVNAQNAGNYYVNSVQVSGISSSCAGVDFTLEAFDTSTSTSTPLISAGVPDLIVYDNAGTFQAAVAGVDVTSGSGTFTANFLSPYALSHSIYRFTLQTSSHASSCWTGDYTSTCAPVGGIQFGNTAGSQTGYLTMSTGFSAGDTFTVEAWVKATNMANENAVVILGAGANNYALTVRNTNASQWSVDMSGWARMNFNLPSGTMANDTWHYVVVAKDSNGIAMWVNGTKLNYISASCGANCVAVGSGYTFNRSYTAASTQIGAWANNSWFSRGGVINYLRLSNVALYPTTQSNISLPTSVPTSSGSTKLLLRQAAISPVVDYSSIGQTFTNVGLVSIAN